MVDDRLATIEGTAITNGGTATLTYQDDTAHTIEKIELVEDAGTALNGATGTVSIGGDSVTDQVVPLEVLTENYQDLFPMMLELPQNTEFELAVDNGSGSSITIDVVLYFDGGMGQQP
jgi:hypothetical protein